MVKASMNDHHIERMILICEIFSILVLIRCTFIDIGNSKVSKPDGAHHGLIERPTTHNQDFVTGRNLSGSDEFTQNLTIKARYYIPHRVTIPIFAVGGSIQL